jgi:hypothetical protein
MQQTNHETADKIMIRRKSTLFRTGTYLILCLVTGILSGCGEDANPNLEKQKFTSIFDNKQFSERFSPVDVVQTPDGGYLILSERRLPDSNFSGIYLLKANESGDLVKELTVEAPCVNAVGDLMQSGSDYYFFAMDGLTLEGQLVKVDAQADSAVITPVPGINYPAAAAVDGSNFLLLSYDHTEKTSVISQHNTEGAITKGPQSFGIGAGDDVEEPIIRHFIRTGKRFPFQVGKVSENLYFFNGFQNYTFSLVFTNMNEDNPSGVVQGQQGDGGFSALLPLDGNEFAAARFNFGDNYFLPRVSLQTAGPSVGAYLGGNAMPELVADARVKILKATLSTGDILVYATDTHSKQIGLFFYDATTGDFISSRYLGFSNPFEIADVIQTKDNGLAICGTTYLAGRFPRIALFKLSADDLKHQAE